MMQPPPESNVEKTPAKDPITQSIADAIAGISGDEPADERPTGDQNPSDRPPSDHATGADASSAAKSTDESAQTQESGTAADDSAGRESVTAQATLSTPRNKSPQLLRDLDQIDFVQIGLVLLATFVALWVNKTVLPRLASMIPSRLRLYPLALLPVVRLVVLTLATISIVYLIFDFSLENFLVIAGGASVAIGFAFKDYVSSLIAGIIAVFERPYRLGDWVRIGEHYGEVQSVGMRSLAIQTPADDRITVPHLHLWNENISNSNDGARTLMCVVNFYVRPDHDAATVRNRLRDVALTSAYLNYDRPVVVMLSDEPIGTHYKVKLYPFDLRDQFALISDVTVRGKQALLAAGASPVAAAMGITNDN